MSVTDQAREADETKARIREFAGLAWGGTYVACLILCSVLAADWSHGMSALLLLGEFHLGPIPGTISGDLSVVTSLGMLAGVLAFVAIRTRLGAILSAGFTLMWFLSGIYTYALHLD